MPGHTRKTEKKKKPAKKPAASNGYTLSKRKTKTRTRRA